MSAQPPEPTFQPSGQDQGLTIGRPAWQQPAYPPPAASSDSQPGYPAPPPFPPPGQAYGAPEQSYPGQDQSYPGHEQTYTSIGQGQDYQGYQSAGYGAQPGAGATPPPPPQWQAAPPQAGTTAGTTAGRARQPGEKGFVGSLLDFSFTSFVTPKIVKVLYILFTIWTALIGLSILIIGFKTGGVAGGLFTLIIVEPIFVLLTLGIYRVVLELFVVVFRIYDELKNIRENTGSQS